MSEWSPDEERLVAAGKRRAAVAAAWSLAVAMLTSVMILVWWAFSYVPIVDWWLK